MSCPSQSTQLAEFHNFILTTQLIEFLVSLVFVVHINLLQTIMHGGN